ncbi:MAG: aminotransferase class III-fold pyridoxal phosphate-dependent enzyme [Anaerolineales bacterium]|nr:aminotransferase class III-fold pyridoxal phosphate-dependent enzyme [Anaerolineales bacterium]
MPAAIRTYMISLPYNDIELFERAMVEHGEELAAVVLEPVMGNVACILPDLAWLQRVRALCDEFGVVLIFDEVKTGFRLARGGAQEYFGVKADLAAYAKAMGNGFPVSAVAGRDEIMAMVEPGRVAHGGTYCGNVVAATAAAATLEDHRNAAGDRDHFRQWSPVNGWDSCYFDARGRAARCFWRALNVQRAAGEGRSADRLSQLQ